MSDAEPVDAVSERGRDGDAALERWRRAESQLYPLIVSDPDLYQLAVQLVVEARDALRSCGPSVEALLAVDPAAVLAGCPSTPAVREQGLDPAVAFRAACAQRMRELSGGDGSSPTLMP